MKKSFKMMGMAAMVLLLAVSCKKENKEEAAGETKAMTFTAGINQGNGKTYLEGQKLLWSDGDVININNQEFTLAEGAGTNKGVFTGEAAEADVYYAVYPYKDENTVDLATGIATITLPAEQTYVNGSFGKDIAPMVAMTDDNKSFTFTNVCGLLRLDFANISKPFDKIVLESANGEYLAGEGTVAITGDGNESLGLTDASSNSKTITMSTSGVTSGIKVVFVLPAGTLKHGFNVYFYAGDEQFDAVSTSADMEIEAGKMNIVTVDHVVNIQAATIRPDAVTTTTLKVPYEIKDECVSASIQCATDGEFQHIVGTYVIPIGGTKNEPFKTGTAQFTGLTEATLYHVRILVKTSGDQEEKPYCTIVAETLGGDVPPTPTTPKFSVDDDVYVTFAPGNLWYDGSEFRFEENQWSFADTWKEDHVSHFYWSQYEETAVANEPDLNETVEIGNVFFTEKSGFTVNGGESSKWHTLTNDEWDYLFNSRIPETTYGNNFKTLTISGSESTVTGLVLLPDDSETELSSIEETDDLAKYNAVFLPAAGWRMPAYISTDSDHLYLTRSVASEYTPYALQIMLNSLDPNYGINNDWGCAIRLVKYVE